LEQGCQLYSCEFEGHRPYFRLLLEGLWYASPEFLPELRCELQHIGSKLGVGERAASSGNLRETSAGTVVFTDEVVGFKLGDVGKNGVWDLTRSTPVGGVNPSIAQAGLSETRVPDDKNGVGNRAAREPVWHAAKRALLELLTERRGHEYNQVAPLDQVLDMCASGTIVSETVEDIAV